MSGLHWFGGEAGGIGKSIVCSSAIAYHQSKGLDCAIFDTDRTKPDVFKAHKKIGCQLAILSEAERYENGANTLFNAALEKTVLCNLPANSFIALAQWLQNNDLLALAAECDVRFHHWFVCDGTPLSTALLKKSLRHFNGAVPHIVVKNFGKTENWRNFDRDEEVQDLVAHYQVLVVEFPKFIGNTERQEIAAKQLTLLEAEAYEEFRPISKQRVKKFLRESAAVFEATGLFS